MVFARVGSSHHRLPLFNIAVSLARATEKALSTILTDLRCRTEGSDADVMQLFQPSLDVYDAVLELSSAVLVRHLHALDGKVFSSLLN